jgi:hypothetical protein
MNEIIPKPVPHYLQSVGSIAEVDGGKKTVFFYPSLVFPNPIELCSVSLLYNNTIGEMKVSISTLKQKNTLISDDCLKHPKDKFFTTKIYGKPKIVNAHEPFYFYYDGEIKDSSIVIAFKSVN